MSEWPNAYFEVGTLHAAGDIYRESTNESSKSTHTWAHSMQGERLSHLDPTMLAKRHLTSEPCNSKTTTARGEAYALNGGVVNKPADTTFAFMIDQAAWQLVSLVRIENLFHDVFFASTCRHESDLESGLRYGKRNGDALGRGLRRIGDVQNPSVLFPQEVRAREQATGVAIRPTAKQEQVEER